MRINKYLADKDIASRREGDLLIKQGKVFINGKKALLGAQVNETDVVEIKNNDKSYAYFAYNKPVGIVTSTPQGDEVDIVHHTIFPTEVYPIGRLDKDSHGLIIMTNDGRVTKKLLDPESEHEKEYEVEIDDKITDDFIENMSGGVEIETNKKAKHFTKAADVKKIGPKKFSIVLVEGKNRQIRRMCEALGYEVVDLKRVRIGGVHLGNLKPGKFSVIEKEDLE